MEEKKQNDSGIIKQEFEEHQSGMKHYMRDMILGVNDGLVSIFLLVAGIAGAGVGNSTIALSAVAATIAGAISMMAGEYISTKSQEEVYQAEIELEKGHIKNHKEHEISELYEMFGDMGFSGDVLEEIVRVVSMDDEVMLKVMLALEFGINEENRRSPIKAMMTVAVLFIVGASPSILPFLFTTSPEKGLVFASVFSAIFLLAIGALKTLMTKTSVIKSSFENLFIGIIGATISYFLGSMYGGVI